MYEAPYGAVRSELSKVTRLKPGKCLTADARSPTSAKRFFGIAGEGQEVRDRIVWALALQAGAATKRTQFPIYWSDSAYRPDGKSRIRGLDQRRKL